MKQTARCITEGCGWRAIGDSVMVTQRAVRHEIDQKKRRHEVKIEEIKEFRMKEKYIVEIESDDHRVLTDRAAVIRRVQGDSLAPHEHAMCAMVDGLRPLDDAALAEIAEPLTTPLHQTIDELQKELETLRAGAPKSMPKQSGKAKTDSSDAG